MAFTADRAYDLLHTAYERQRLPHALMFTGADEETRNALALRLLALLNGTKFDTMEQARDEYCRIVRPKSKSRRILLDDLRAVEPFLQRKAEETKWKVLIFVEAERMNEEVANAFLKTLEEPPSRCLIILLTGQPEQMLRTILSRCVRVPLLSDGRMRLTSIQKRFMPIWSEACTLIGDDVAAPALRAALMALLATAKAELTATLTKALKDEAKEIAGGTDTNDWESSHKDDLNALIETEYLDLRAQTLDLMIAWFGYAVLLKSGAPELDLPDESIRTLAASEPVDELLLRLEAITRLRDDLNFNIHEGLAFDVRLLEALGSTPGRL